MFYSMCTFPSYTWFYFPSHSVYKASRTDNDLFSNGILAILFVGKPTHYLVIFASHIYFYGHTPACIKHAYSMYSSYSYGYHVPL